ncbi:small acid-soluble spore protein H [Bacillus capparidis]|uniref:Small, acid-soluble spore protein H n=1 Tax=Bacillus capparidis TaxID=1840411 RepID=A0ABS4CTD1_9BACI|nr:small acid-soluble spore protein H [Bacillus capparidis]MBP1080595.1 small acid-soluble spore protein H (minor) [Bacillus capparidis]MED1094451.1 small acid-soluble spore protein H [Bacillus capparidis]
MDIQRAQEIVASPEMINVTYNGVSVYIQNIDEKSEMASIYPLDEPNKEQEIPLTSLMEQ